jgi:hypothetical protein
MVLFGVFLVVAVLVVGFLLIDKQRKKEFQQDFALELQRISEGVGKFKAEAEAEEKKLVEEVAKVKQALETAEEVIVSKVKRKTTKK